MQNETSTLNSFSVSFELADISTGISDKETTAASAIMHNRFPYIGVHSNRMKEYQGLLNYALLNQYAEQLHLDKETFFDDHDFIFMKAVYPFFSLVTRDYFDESSSQYFELEVLKIDYRCQDLPDALFD